MTIVACFCLVFGIVLMFTGHPEWGFGLILIGLIVANYKSNK